MQTKICIVGAGLSNNALDSLKAEIAKIPDPLDDYYQKMKDDVHTLSYEALGIKNELPRLEKVKDNAWFRKFEKRRF